ncbi:uncharacterized protein MKK02DRAFT_38217 [Dioszegia hungarica]|uniref:Ribosomal protein L9 domain-containing protein n=1 Tax=Dioszegia hungarica TaxID=4972 RepID=A0AA38H3Z2_9TREE|nr:uncharacterized protein MKK02DRAFT_38217 [Dioszegia hungarica]KAI9633561.1 hypothetical protein MKK02DRAFT_38217 [Dioszegia hungarica]
MAFVSLRSALRTGRPSLPCGIAAFSSSAPSSSRRQVLIQLLEDVDGLGFTNDRVLVNPGRARNQLLPTGQARFVPWKRPSDRVQQRTERAPPPTASAPSASEPAAVPPTSAAVLEAIQSLPVSFHFPHRTISPKAKTIYGSVTLADVVKRLEDDYKIPSGVNEGIGTMGS